MVFSAQVKLSPVGRGSVEPTCFEDAVHARDGVHQSVTPHWFVHIHGVRTGRVEARQPRVAPEHDFQPVLRILEPLRRVPRAGACCERDPATPTDRTPTVITIFSTPLSLVYGQLSARQ